MAEEIRNRVAESKLVVIDLEDYYPEGERTLLDISPWLVEGIILVEKQFRETVNSLIGVFLKINTLHFIAKLTLLSLLGPSIWLLLNSIK